MVKTIIVLLILITVCTKLQAQVYTKVFQASSAGTGLLTYSYPHFTSEKCGYAQTSDKRLVKTTDGGETWFLLKTPADFYFSIIRFTNDTVGYLVELDYQLKKLNFYKSINGGITWILIQNIEKFYERRFVYMESKQSQEKKVESLFSLTSSASPGSNFLYKYDVFNNIWYEIILHDKFRNSSRQIKYQIRNSDTLYLIMDGRLYCLSDEWKNLTENPLFDSIKGYINDFYLHPDGTLVLIGNPYSYISKDAGKTWSIEADSSLSGRMIRGIGNNIIFNNLESYNVANCYYSNNLGDSVIKMDSSFRELLWTGEYTDFVFRDSVTAFFFANSFNSKAIIKVDFSKNVSSIDDNQKESELKTRISIEEVTIESTFPILSVDCYSLLGNKLTTTMELSENTVTVVKSSLPSGVYYLHVQTTRGMEVVPFMNVR